jgi:tetratricopeptide (TPR) repeat protein
MGAVYEAEQDNPRRAVALKVIKAGWATPELLHRFTRETEALARLQHPGIAQIYEAGTAETAFGTQPYFAMEFIRGTTLREYAQTHRYDTRARLLLIAKICEAVHHAHQRGLIHRDLKPGNILIDEAGEPKILDFGVARITDSDAQATCQTDVGQLIGTLAYMSPEQVLADPLEVDTRSDVYALGVILYELLAERLPYQINNNLHEAVTAIREEEPAQLSSINRAYRGDIETIVAKALEKDKTRRYASAAGLAADIHRYLTHQPIAARPASVSYQLQKFTRRHRALVAAVAVVFVVLVGGVVASAWQAVRANRERDRATTAERTARAVNDFLQTDVLAQAGAHVQANRDTRPDPDLKVRTALDRAASRIQGKFANQPVVEAAIRETIGNSYQDLGLYPQARIHMERALELNRRVLGRADPQTLRSARSLASLYREQTLYARAEALLTEALNTQRASLGAEHRDTLSTKRELGATYWLQSRFPQAEAIWSEVLQARRRLLGQADPETLQSLDDLGNLYTEWGKYAQSEPLLLQAMEGRRQVLGPDHPDTLMSTYNMAGLYRLAEKYAQAQPLIDTVVEARRRILGEDHPDTLFAMNELASLYQVQGRFPEAEALFLKTFEIRRRVLGPEDRQTLISANNLAVLYENENKLDLAGPLLIQLLEANRRVLGEDHQDTLTAMNNLGSLYFQQKKYSLAEPVFAKALEGYRRVKGPEDPFTLRALVGVGFCRLQLKNYADAEPVLREALRIWEKNNPNSWQRFRLQSLLGVTLAGLKRNAEAEPLLLSGYQGLVERKTSLSAANRPNIELAAGRLAQFYEDSGNPGKAAEWRAKSQGNAAAAPVR